MHRTLRFVTALALTVAGLGSFALAFAEGDVHVALTAHRILVSQGKEARRHRRFHALTRCAFYPHAFVAGSAGAVTFGTAQAPSPAVPGWSIDLVLDLDCDGTIDPGEVTVGAALPLIASERVCLVARHAAPATAPAGASEQATLTASFTYVSASPALSSSGTLADVTTVLVGGTGLVLTKAVDRASALPGELITYTINYTNLSNAPLSAIELADATPAWTVFEDATCGAPGAGLSACGVSQQPAAGATGAVRWTLAGALLPGGKRIRRLPGARGVKAALAVLPSG